MTATHQNACPAPFAATRPAATIAPALRARGII
jgi:hypothetical protein